MTNKKIIECGTMLDGTKIFLVKFRSLLYGEYMQIVALPRLAVSISPTRKVGDVFPLCICEDLDDDATYTGVMLEKDYQSLIKGKKRLEDLSDHFSGGTLDMRHLGMEV